MKLLNKYTKIKYFLRMYKINIKGLSQNLCKIRLHRLKVYANFRIIPKNASLLEHFVYSPKTYVVFILSLRKSPYAMHIII